MDIGIVASRYAKALLRFSSHNQEEQVVYAEMKQLHYSYQKTPQLPVALANPTLSDTQKRALLQAAVQSQEGAPPTRSTTQFVNLVTSHKRTNLMPFIAVSFLNQYEREKKMTSARLVVAAPVGAPTEKRLTDLVAQRSGNENVQLSVSIDPQLQAGFVLEYDDYRMDASLSGWFERLRSQFKK